MTLDGDIVSAFPAFATLEAAARRVIADCARVAALPAGTVLFHERAECSSYVLVLDGAIRVQKVAENGREIVLYRVERGQSCVLTTNCLLARQDYGAEGIAESAVRALILPAAHFRDLLAQSAVFRDFVFASYAERMSELLLLIEEVAFGRIDARLAGWLLQRGAEIHATHHEIAAELGTVREVISRQLKEFERRGWLVLNRGRIALLDRPALSGLASNS